MMNVHAWNLPAAACLLVMWCAFPPTHGARADETRCAGTNVTVHALDREDADSGCEGAADAVTFLVAQGLDTTASIEVRVVERLPDVVAGASAFGCYVRSEHRVYMLAFSECSKLTLGPDLPVDRPLYRSLVTHEVAHRIAVANVTVAKPTATAQEYVAYVTMFATMAPAQRARILERFPGTGFDSERQIGMLIYLLDPNRFGAEAYRHFVKPDNGQPFLQRVLSGSALAAEEPP